MKRFLHTAEILLIVLLGLTQPVLAWSAWNWTSAMTPLNLLPVMIVVAISIEIVVIRRCIKADFKPVAWRIALINCLSLVAPYGLEWLMSMPVGSDFLGYIEQWRIYTISWGYGILTVAVEIPILYRQFSARFENQNLLANLLEANLLTTAIIFVIERIACEGAWLSM